LTVAVLVPRVLLAVVFVISATAKLRDRAGGRRAVIDLGLPARWAGPLAVMVPVAELVSAGALLYPSSAPAGAVLAVVLLSSFTAVVVWNLMEGRRPSCHCFGGLSEGAVGWPSVARNALFATLAVSVLAGGQPIWLLVAVAVASAAGWLGPPAWRRWLERVGTSVDGFALPGADGAVWTLDDLVGRGRPVVLVFSTPHCGGCETMMPDVARWQQTEDARLTMAVVSGGPAAASVAKAEQYGLRRLLVDEQQTVFRSFGVTVTPTAVLVNPDRTVAAAPALGAGEIERLVEETLAAGTPAVGTLAPNPPASGIREPVTRRAAVQRFATGMGIVVLAPVLGTIAAACGSTVGAGGTGGATGTSLKRGRQLKVKGAWLCDQRYALCTSAACKPTPTNPSVSICHCFVQDGYSMAYGSCEARKPSGNRLSSSFSTQKLTSKSAIMTCPASVPWANCLDAPCEVDPKDPTRAICQCPVVETGPSVIFGGDCDTAACTSAIWSGAAPPGLAQFGQALQEVGGTAHFPRVCKS